MSGTQLLNRGDGIDCPNEKGPTVAAVAPLESDQNEKPDCRGATPDGQAQRAIDKAVGAQHG